MSTIKLDPAIDLGLNQNTNNSFNNSGYSDNALTVGDSDPNSTKTNSSYLPSFNGISELAETIPTKNMNNNYYIESENTTDLPNIIDRSEYRNSDKIVTKDKPKVDISSIIFMLAFVFFILSFGIALYFILVYFKLI